jgi:hypothetical protein
MKKVTADVLTVGQLPQQDQKSFIQWAYKMLRKTKFNMEVLRHPRMVITRALYDGEPGMFVPLRPVLMFDVLTPDPSLSNMERAIGMRRIDTLLEEQIMPNTGMYDAFATVNDDTEADMMAKHGWTEVKGVRLLQKRISVPASVASTTEPATETVNV